MYEIIDSRTMQVVARAKTLKGALSAIDRRDAQHGGSVHFYRRVSNVH